MGPSPRRPPPTPRSAPKAEVPDNNADNTTPVWNTAVANLPAFLVSLDQNDSLLSSVPGLLTLWTRGYEIDGKGRKVVESDKHMLWLLNNPDTEIRVLLRVSITRRQPPDCRRRRSARRRARPRHPPAARHIGDGPASRAGEVQITTKGTERDVLDKPNAPRRDRPA